MCLEDVRGASHEVSASQQPPAKIAELFVDSHCHPTDDPSAYTSPNIDELSSRIDNVVVGRLVCMSTNARDQTMVAELASRHPDKVIPCFGWHPWFAHQISLSDPAPSKHEHYHSLFGIPVNIQAEYSPAKQELDACGSIYQIQSLWKACAGAFASSSSAFRTRCWRGWVGPSFPDPAKGMELRP